MRRTFVLVLLLVLTAAGSTAAYDTTTYHPMRTGVHNAGPINMPVGCGYLAYTWCKFRDTVDTETGQRIPYGLYYSGDGVEFYLMHASIWVGGIVGDDTLVSEGYINVKYQENHSEFWPDDSLYRGVARAGGFADDEFRALYTDTLVVDSLTGPPRPLSGLRHRPLGIQVRQHSYTWTDTEFDDFVITEFTIKNISDHSIHEGWTGFYIYPCCHDTMKDYDYTDCYDEFTGVLDTLLDDNDVFSRVVIPYALDNDGDPNSDYEWDSASARGTISCRIIAPDLIDPVMNYNWWVSGSMTYDYGPRRLGTPEDPFREFAGGQLGTPYTDRDKYYLLSHPEIDYDQFETGIHDSTDGWIPAPYVLDGYSPLYLLSAGPFDLAPGDSTKFTLALAVTDSVHVFPDNLLHNYDPDNPFPYRDNLDLGRILAQHRRIDSVYKSGYTLPHPGPPGEIRIVDYDDSFVTVSWLPKDHPGVIGYYVSVRDDAYGEQWYHTTSSPISDTLHTFAIGNPGHEYTITVSTVDNRGHTSLRSLPLRIVPSRPHTPIDLIAALDSITPELHWSPYDDTSLVSYIVYRRIWEGEFEAHDSVIVPFYKDYDTETGVRYTYRVTACGEDGQQSPPTPSVAVLPMALDRGIMFCNLNYDQGAILGAYQRRFLFRLVHAIEPHLPLTFFDLSAAALSFRNMSRYELIIFDAENRGGSFPNAHLDSIDNYLTHGGKAIFIIPNASGADTPLLRPRTTFYGSGNMFHDILYLDSAVTGAIVISDNALQGDLIGCTAQMPGFPDLEMDTVKLAASAFPISGGIPLAGCLFPREGVDILYRYQSRNPDTLMHDQVNGIMQTDGPYRFVLLNFPLSAMAEPWATGALRGSLNALGYDPFCGDVNYNASMDVGDALVIIDYLFRSGPEPDQWRGDVNCNGGVDLADVLDIINVIFRDGGSLRCCPK